MVIPDSAHVTRFLAEPLCGEFTAKAGIPRSARFLYSIGLPHYGPAVSQSYQEAETAYQIHPCLCRLLQQCDAVHNRR